MIPLKKKIKIGLMGDVMLGRSVDQYLDNKRYDYPWGEFKSILKSNDLNILNLENAFTNSPCETPKVFNFKAKPDRVNVLKAGNIHLVNLANNHILDYGEDGLIETIYTLDEAHIDHVGAGENFEEAQKGKIIQRGGIRIGVLGLTDNESGWKAGIEPGTNYVNLNDTDAIINELHTIRPYVDFLIVSIHWGPNMVSKPFKEHIQLAHLMIDYGVDLIHGHSAHVFQGIEIYKGKTILYDTGDFIDDYMVDPSMRNDFSFFFQCEIENKKVSRIELIPVLIKNFQATRARGILANSIVRRMKNLCQKFQTNISIEDDKGIIKIQ